MRCVLLLLLLTTCVLLSGSEWSTEQLAEVTDADLPEISGMAASRRHEGLLWLHNDGAHPPVLYAVGADGVVRGRVRVLADNRDWEDIAAFRWQDEDWLLIAEFGDNEARYTSCRLLLLREPGPADNEAPVAAVLDYVYEDGPRDAEGLAVDVPGGRILILSKRDTPPRLYALPLDFAVGGVQTARLLTTVATIPPPSDADLERRYGRYAAQPTAIDLSPDGRRLLIACYKHLLLYERAADEDWAAALARTPELIERPSLKQAESACFDRLGAAVWHGSEQLPSPLLRSRPRPAP